MAYEVTSIDVGTCAADLIAWADTADTCLTAKSVPHDLGRLLKINLIKHVQELQSGGAVTSQTAVSGASRSFSDDFGAYKSSYGKLLAQMDKTGCVVALIGGGGYVQFRSAGRTP